jgi:hypothetical protein
MCAITCGVGEADWSAGNAVSSRFVETSKKKSRIGSKIGDDERSKSPPTRYPNTDTVLQCVFLGSNALYRPFEFFRSCLCIDDYTDQQGHAITMNRTIQGCRPRPLELELHILFCLSCTVTKKHLNHESSEHRKMQANWRNDCGCYCLLVCPVPTRPQVHPKRLHQSTKRYGVTFQRAIIFEVKVVRLLD